MKSSQIQTHYFHFLKKKEILESLPLHVLLSRRKEIIINDLGIIFPQLVKARASAEVQNRARSPGPQSLAGWWCCWRTIFPLWMDLQMSDVQEGVGAYQTVSTSICGTHKSSTPSSVTGLPWTTYGYSIFFSESRPVLLGEDLIFSHNLDSCRTRLMCLIWLSKQVNSYFWRQKKKYPKVFLSWANDRALSKSQASGYKVSYYSTTDKFIGSIKPPNWWRSAEAMLFYSSADTNSFNLRKHCNKPAVRLNRAPGSKGSNLCLCFLSHQRHYFDLLSFCWAVV